MATRPMQPFPGAAMTMSAILAGLSRPFVWIGALMGFLGQKAADDRGI